MVPPEVVVTPIVVNGAVSAVFYGDNLPGGHPITAIHGLELLMIEAGLAIERNVLAERLSWLEQTMSAISGDEEDGDSNPDPDDRIQDRHPEPNPDRSNQDRKRSQPIRAGVQPVCD